MLITCTCYYDLTKGTQDKDFSYSFSILSFTHSPLIGCCNSRFLFLSHPLTVSAVSLTLIIYTYCHH